MRWMLSASQAGPALPKAARMRGRGEGDEGVGAAGLHLHQQRLALVQHHAARIADRLAAPVARQAGLVERVAGLVQHAHQGAGEVGLVVARGDAHVVGGAAGEGMRRDVEPAVMEVEAQRARHLDARACAAPRPGTGRRAAAAAAPLLLRRHHLLQHRRQEGLELAEQRVDACRSGRPARTRRAARRRATGRAPRPWPRRPAW